MELEEDSSALDISLTWLANPEAAHALEAAGRSSFSFDTAAGAPIPIAGDLVSFGDEEAPVFRVINRLFMWKSRMELVVQLQVGLLPGDPLLS